MNRPKAFDDKYTLIGNIIKCDIDYMSYINDLSKYCDELEHFRKLASLAFLCSLETDEHDRKLISKYEKEIINLKQALDKATDELALNGKMVGMTDDFIMYSKKATKEEWEQWLLNGE